MHMRDVYTVLILYTYALCSAIIIYMWSYFTWRCFSLSIRVVRRVCVQLLLLLLAMFYFFTLFVSVSVSLSLKITSRIRVLFMYRYRRYSIHWSLILSGYIVVVFDHRRTVHFRQDKTYRYMLHFVCIINATVHVSGYLRWNLQISLMLSSCNLTTRRLDRLLRVFFKLWYLCG